MYDCYDLTKCRKNGFLTHADVHKSSKAVSFSIQFKIAGVFVAGYTSELQLDSLYLAVLASKFTPKGAVGARYMAGA